MCPKWLHLHQIGSDQVAPCIPDTCTYMSYIVCVYMKLPAERSRSAWLELFNSTLQNTFHFNAALSLPLCLCLSLFPSLSCSFLWVFENGARQFLYPSKT